MTIYLERGQGRIDLKEAVAGANGHVSIGEQARSQNAENKQARNSTERSTTTLPALTAGSAPRGTNRCRNEERRSVEQSKWV